MSKIRIMLSSRCETEVKDEKKSVKLSVLRKELKKQIEAEKLFDKELFEVWISEEPRGSSNLESSWNECMSQVDKSDIFICIYTGEGGWAKNKSDIGICHGELETAFNKEPAKVYTVNAVEAVTSVVDKKDLINKRMASYIDKTNRFYKKANTKNEIIDVAKQIVGEATIKLAKMGKREARKGKYNFGEALDWTRMDFIERKDAIEKEITEQLLRSGNEMAGECVRFSVDKKEYLLKIHGIPSGMGVSSAREMVGQPFLKDHKIATDAGDKSHGPIHIVGVHKGVTEQQAIGILGHPDAVVVDGPFGIYIADKIQKIQMVFLVNCRDSASTRHNVQKFIDWLDESGENESLFKRAEGRRQIIDVINKQL